MTYLVSAVSISLGYQQQKRKNSKRFSAKAAQNPHNTPKAEQKPTKAAIKSDETPRKNAYIATSPISEEAAKNADTQANMMFMTSLLRPN